MQNIVVLAILLFYFPVAWSESWFNFGNTVSTGKITINGQEMGSSGDFIKGSGIKKTLNREVKDFVSVISRGGFDIKYRSGAPSLSISGDDNIIDFVRTEVVNSSLQISIDKSYSSKFPIIINISSTKIESVAIHGVSDAEFNAIKSVQLKINLSGTVNMFANGKVTRLQIKVNGTGDVKLKSLVADVVSVDLQGAGDIELTARKQLDAKIFGVGDIRFFGNPGKINKQIFGVGDIVAGE